MQSARTERCRRRSTTLPPGYPFFIAAIAKIVGRPAVAATVISMLSFTLLPFALRLAAPIGIGAAAFRTAVLFLIFSSPLIFTAVSVGTEGLFTLALTAAVACFCRALAGRGESETMWLAAGWLLAGISYWIRYAGLFVIVGSLLFFSLQFAFQRCRRARRALAWSVLAVGIAGAGMIRNLIVSGTWKGGVTDTLSLNRSDLPALIRRVASGLYHAMLGGSSAPLSGPGGALFLAGVGVLLVFGILGKTRSRKAKAPHLWFIPAVIAVYTLGVAYAMRTMVISSGGFRYFIPLIPPVCILAAAWLSSIAPIPQKRAFYIASLAIATAGYFAIHARNLLPRAAVAPHRKVMTALSGAAGDSNVSAWFQLNVGPSETITASNGQATAYALRRQTLCLADAPYSASAWTERTIMEQMDRFGSQYLVLYPNMPPEISAVQEQSAFLSQMLQGRTVNWLRVVARNNSTIVFRRTAIRPGNTVHSLLMEDVFRDRR